MISSVLGSHGFLCSPAGRPWFSDPNPWHFRALLSADFKVPAPCFYDSMGPTCDKTRGVGAKSFESLLDRMGKVEKKGRISTKFKKMDERALKKLKKFKKE